MQNLTSQILGYAEQMSEGSPLSAKSLCISGIVLRSTRPFRV